MQALREQWPSPAADEVGLWFTQYNYSAADFEANREWYIEHQLARVSTVMENPELMKLQLTYFHPNGTVYHVDPASGSYAIACEGCFGTESLDVRKGRLLWQLDTFPDPVDVDAETGKIVWPQFIKHPFPYQLAIYQNISEARTIREESQAWMNPPKTTVIEILAGSSSNDTAKSFRPENTRGIFEISNRVVWTNEDAVAHTVRYDDRYPVRLGEQFNSGSIPPGGTYEHTFDHEGEYPYHCDIHPWMKGVVRIEPNFA